MNDQTPLQTNRDNIEKTLENMTQDLHTFRSGSASPWWLLDSARDLMGFVYQAISDTSPAKMSRDQLAALAQKFGEMSKFAASSDMDAARQSSYFYAGIFWAASTLASDSALMTVSEHVDSLLSDETTPTGNTLMSTKNWKDKPGSILWIDVETTSANPGKGLILEAAFHLTDRQGNPYPQEIGDIVFANRIPENYLYSKVDPASLMYNMRALSDFHEIKENVPTKTKNGTRLVTEYEGCWSKTFTAWIISFYQRLIKTKNFGKGHLTQYWPISVGGWGTLFDIMWLLRHPQINLINFECDITFLDATVIDARLMAWTHLKNKHTLRDAYPLITGKEMGDEHHSIEDAIAASEIFHHITKDWE